MTNREAVIWLINITADIGKTEHQELWHYEQALTEIKEMLETEPQRMRGRWIEDGYNDEKAVCDQCGEPCATYIMGKPRDKYCKWCGADMRGDLDG